MKMHQIVLSCLAFLLSSGLPLHASSEVINNERSESRNVTFFLSTQKSGTNVIAGCLSAITRKPVSWVYWGDLILDPEAKQRQHVSYNRLKLELQSDIPLFYRTHDAFELKEVPSKLNKLIFVTRNPKELLYRAFFLYTPSEENPSPQFVEKFLKSYLNRFRTYERWCPKTRKLVFYEDFIVRGDEILLELLEFMEEPSSFWDDFIAHKQEYLTQLLSSYSRQHVQNGGGTSSKEGPKAIHYTKDASIEVLKSIDAYFQQNAPRLWKKYLNRFET